MRKAQKKPPTFYPVNSLAGQSQPRQCECCEKLQTIGEGFNIERELCAECVKGFSETVGGAVAYTIRPSLWTRFKNWLKGIA